MRPRCGILSSLDSAPTKKPPTSSANKHEENFDEPSMFGVRDSPTPSPISINFTQNTTAVARRTCAKQKCRRFTRLTRQFLTRANDTISPAPVPNKPISYLATFAFSLASAVDRSVEFIYGKNFRRSRQSVTCDRELAIMTRRPMLSFNSRQSTVTSAAIFIAFLGIPVDVAGADCVLSEENIALARVVSKEAKLYFVSGTRKQAAECPSAANACRG